ncbi:peptidylprolyl isomerase [Polyangium sp. y55x31]|uniref:peptidylprolyl isomerase n=1 Tax=Polyangium sp. y55x31 TaxID=3042688 RepID=UPI0024832760|nr:peptidylprolyl isomerase [Polyangium sp. y55x31]MDI1475529.1 peptidylprolyl isomerase [Polyangium sp. y55x31]
MNKLTSILGGFAVIAIALVFIVQFRPNASQQMVETARCAVEIRGACISSGHYWASYRMLAPRGADQEWLRQRNLRKITAEGLVERQLLNEDAKRLGITISDDELNAELTSGRMHVSMPVSPVTMPDGRVVDPRGAAYMGMGGPMLRYLNVKNRQTGKFDLKAYEREVRMVAKMSPQEFREYQKEEIIAARMRDLVRSRAVVGEAEAFARYNQDKSTATVSYVRLDKRFFADLVADKSQKAIDAWVALNKEEEERQWNSRKSSYLPECRVTRHILAKIDQDNADPADAKAKAKEKIEQAKARLDKGESFADVARAMSEDGSAERGGLLGCVTKGKMVKPFEDAMLKAEPGKVTDIVESEFGYHLVLVDKVAKDLEAEAVGRAEVDEDLYLKFETERLTAEAAKAILAAVKGGKTLDQAVDTYLSELEAKLATKDEKKDGKAKKDDKKKDDTKDEAKKDEAAAESPVRKHPQRPVVESSLPFNASGSPIPGMMPGSNAATAAFKLEKPGDAADEIVQLFTGYAVMVLKEKKPASKEDWEKDRPAFMAQFREEKQEDALVAYISRLRNTLGTEIKFGGAEFTTEAKPPKDGAEDFGE